MSTFETAYLVMLGDPSKLPDAIKELKKLDPTGTGTPEQRNRALIHQRNPMTADERNKAKVGT